MYLDHMSTLPLKTSVQLLGPRGSAILGVWSRESRPRGVDARTPRSCSARHLSHLIAPKSCILRHAPKVWSKSSALSLEFSAPSRPANGKPRRLPPYRCGAARCTMVPPWAGNPIPERFPLKGVDRELRKSRDATHLGGRRAPGGDGGALRPRRPLRGGPSTVYRVPVDRVDGRPFGRRVYRSLPMNLRLQSTGRLGRPR